MPNRDDDKTEDLTLPAGALGADGQVPETPCPAPGACPYGAKPAGYRCTLALEVEMPDGRSVGVCMPAASQIENLRMIGAARRAHGRKIAVAPPGAFPGASGRKH